MSPFSFVLVLIALVSGKATAYDECSIGLAYNPGYSCSHIYENDPDASDGLFHIQIRGNKTKTIPVYCDMKNGGLTMIFKITAGVPGNAYALYQSNQTLNEDLMPVLSPKTDERVHYKNSLALAENWRAFAAQEVDVVLYKDGKEELRLVFDGRFTTHTNWLSKSRLVLSPYTDIQSSPQNYFSLEGQQAPSIDVDRSFYINEKHGGCDADQGWLSLVGRGYCPYEKNNYIRVKYSKGSTVAIWSSGGANVGDADSMIIYVR